MSSPPQRPTKFFFTTVGIAAAIGAAFGTIYTAIFAVTRGHKLQAFEFIFAAAFSIPTGILTGIVTVAFGLAGGLLVKALSKERDVPGDPVKPRLLELVALTISALLGEVLVLGSSVLSFLTSGTAQSFVNAAVIISAAVVGLALLVKRYSRVTLQADTRSS